MLIEDLTLAVGAPEERPAAFRRTRDLIRNRMQLFMLAGGRNELPAPQPTVLP